MYADVSVDVNAHNGPFLMVTATHQDAKQFMQAGHVTRLYMSVKSKGDTACGPLHDDGEDDQDGACAREYTVRVSFAPMNAEHSKEGSQSDKFEIYDFSFPSSACDHRFGLHASREVFAVTTLGTDYIPTRSNDGELTRIRCIARTQSG
jgi:hypothetical protein